MEALAQKSQIPDSAPLHNLVLASLAPGDLARIAPYLEPVELPQRKMLESRNRPIETITFPDSGVASTVVSNGDVEVEAGLIGHEGMTGHGWMLGADRAAFEVFVQIAGHGRQIAAQHLRAAMEDRPGLRQALLRQTFLFQVQTSYTALANARYRLEARLARWLLMAQDRVQRPTLELTHEFLSLMLGVRRPGVTVTLRGFEERQVIRTHRGSVTILDRAALVKAADGCYGAPEAEYQRLCGQP